MEASAEDILKVKRLTVSKTGGRVLDGISFSLQKGDHVAITGPSGSGKTQLGLALASKNPMNGIEWSPVLRSEGIVWVEQQHHFKNLSNTGEFYYQQRYNANDAADAVTVDDYLGGNAARRQELLEGMSIAYLSPVPLLQLSNGENKKVQLAKALLAGPEVLILDRPFTGLDVATRQYLHALINELAAKGILLLLITGADEMPACINKVISLEEGRLVAMEGREEFERRRLPGKREERTRKFDLSLLERMIGTPSILFERVVHMKNVNVRYGDKHILRDINWEVKAGERWLLSGPNGVGKSTLLSLITADNPQAYANEIYLFDRKRGSGESIWDIKKRIGYLSPELHVFFDQSATCFEVIASGLFDTIGLFRQVPEQQVRLVHDWMELAGILPLFNKRLFELSVGQQRLVLLLRALVKNPPLLILDEPYQGLDDEQQEEFSLLIDAICTTGNKTLLFVTHEVNRVPSCVNKRKTIGN